MQAYQVIENGKPLEKRDLETPTPKGNEVLLKTVACGVCHSDVHILTVISTWVVVCNYLHLYQEANL